MCDGSLAWSTKQGLNNPSTESCVTGSLDSVALNMTRDKLDKVTMYSRKSSVHLSGAVRDPRIVIEPVGVPAERRLV